MQVNIIDNSVVKFKILLYFIPALENSRTIYANLKYFHTGRALGKKVRVKKK